MKIKNLKVPAIIIAIGLVLAIVASMLTGMVKEPTIQEHDFHYTVNYTLNGEPQTLEGVYRCRFTSVGEGTDPLMRDYEGDHLTVTSENHPAAYTIAEADGLELCIVTVFSNRTFMGESDNAAFHYDPYLAIMDQEGMEYAYEEYLGTFDAEITDWVYPQPVDNSFKFVGFSKLHDASMLAMLLVGVLVIAACMIFVKRDKAVPYKALDKVSIVLNFVFTFAAIPFITLVTILMQITVSGDEIGYQMLLCIPALTAFTIAASIALRRKNFTKSGFFIQFVGPVVFVLLLIFSSI